MPTLASHVHDEDVREALCAPAPAEARESLTYWRDRLDSLPRRRRGARREARAMVLAWEERVRRAEVDRWGGGVIGRAAGGLAVLRTVRPGALARRAIGILVPRWVVVGMLTTVLAATLAVGLVLGAILALLL